jgi:GT2 family glycosyltransferase
VVLVVHDTPADRLDAVLSALAAQDYPNLDVLVVATGDTDPGDRVRDALPAARVHRVEGNPGFGAAANVALDTVSGAEFLIFSHDDAAPDPGAVSALVAAADQWGADIVGPKLVDWRDPRRFTQFGLTVDRLGVALPYVERGELDQGQHDGLRDVFAVPGAFTLVRTTRFAEIGGFDEAISFVGDDLSLCWRARVAGARVLVTSAARVRHAEAFADRPAGRAAPRLAARHRVRVLLSSYRLASLAWIVPQALVATVLEAVGALVTGRPGRARAALGAWPWNLWRLRSLVEARCHVARFRTTLDGAIHRDQVRGLVGPRLRLLRVGGDGRTGGGRQGSGARHVAAVPIRGHMDVDPASWSPGTAACAVAVGAVVLFGSRHLLTRGVPTVGEFVPAGGGVGDLLGAWAGGWRSVGLGADGATPSLAAAVAAAGALLAGHVDLVLTLLTVGLVPLGVLGAHRLAAPTGSKRAQVAAAVAYAAVPLPYDALAAGRWSALAAYAAAPWMLGRLALASGVVPYGPVRNPGDARILPAGVGDDLVVPHRLWKHVVVIGAVTALAGLLVPQAPALLVLMGLGLLAGSLLAGDRGGTVRVAVASAAGTVVAAVLLAPTTLDVLSFPGAVDAWRGPRRAPEGLAAADLLALRTGSTAVGGLAFGVLAAATVPLFVARRWRLGWAIRGWMVAVAGWGAVWAREQGWIDGRFPDAGVLLAPAAAGLALATGLGLAALQHDLRGRSLRVGVRRAAVLCGGLALAASSASVVVASLDGRWDMPADDFAGVLGFVDEDVRSVPSRVLWVGDPSLLPGGDGWDLGGSLAYTASTSAAVPGVADLWPGTAESASERLGEALDLALDRDTARLGRVLAPLGVQYVALPERLGPSDDRARAPAGGASVDELAGALAEQLDLERLRLERGIIVYRNLAYVPLRSVPPDPEVLDETSVAGMAAVDLLSSEPVLVAGVDPRAAEGRVGDGATVVQSATSSERWRLTVDGRDAERRTAYGWADAFTVDDGGRATLAYATPGGVRWLAAGQAAAWLLAIAVALRMRFGAGDDPAGAQAAEDRERDGAEAGAAPDGDRRVDDGTGGTGGDDAKGGDVRPAVPARAADRGRAPAEVPAPGGLDKVPVGPASRR